MRLYCKKNYTFGCNFTFKKGDYYSVSVKKNGEYPTNQWYTFYLNGGFFAFHKHRNNKNYYGNWFQTISELRKEKLIELYKS